MANEYASVAELKSTISMSGESFADPDLARALTSASRMVDQITGRRFWLDDVEEADKVRYYTATDTGVLLIDDLVALTELATDPIYARTFSDVWEVDTDYLLAPFNATADGLPYTSISVLAGSQFTLPPYAGSVRVTGQFGWPAVPEVVKQATILIAARLVKRAREAPFGVAGIAFDGAAVRVPASDPDVLALLEPVRKPVYVG